MIIIILFNGKDLEHYSRPIHIGVYGHPNYQWSSFKLEVVIVEKQNEIDYFNENVVDSDFGHDGDHEDETREETDDSIWKHGNSSTLKMIFSIVGSILEILLEVLI